MFKLRTIVSYVIMLYTTDFFNAGGRNSSKGHLSLGIGFRNRHQFSKVEEEGPGLANPPLLLAMCAQAPPKSSSL